MANRVALVTGGNGGIGTEICKQLAAAGYRVVTTCVDAERENIAQWQRDRREEGFEIGYVEADVANYDACVEMAKKVEAEYGPVDVLVNAAGITRDAFLHKMERENWDTLIN